MKTNIDAIRQRNIELGAKHDSLVAANNAILEKCQNEKRDITAAEQVEFDATLKALKQANADLSNQSVMLTEVAAQLERERNAGGVAIAEDGRTEAPKKGARKDGFRSFGEQLQAVSSVARGGRPDPRLLAGDFDGNGVFRAAGGSDGAMNDAVPSEGGFLVGADTSDKIYQRTYATGAIISRCNRIPISTNSNRLKLRVVDEDSRADGSRMGGVLALWDNEADQYVYSRGKFRQIELNLNKLTALVYATDELLADAPALEAWIMQNLPTELAFRVEDALFQGTGVGQPLGVLKTQALLTVNGGTTNAALSVADVLAAWSQFWHPGLSGSIAAIATENLTAGKPGGMPSAAWFVDQSVLPYLFQLQVGTGTGAGVILLYHPPGSNPLYGPYGELLGLPVIPTEHNNNYGTAGDILLADMSQYLLADKGAVQAAASMHVRFVYDEMTFRFTYRVDAQTTWKKPLTPKSGGPNLSPFVVITGGNFR
jgi:HK97 family phage major capsid protein